MWSQTMINSAQSYHKLPQSLRRYDDIFLISLDYAVLQIFIYRYGLSATQLPGLFHENKH